MNKDQREIQRKLRILRYADEAGHVAKTCRYFGLRRDECYLTNLFPFIKSGRASANIPLSVLVENAKRFTLREIAIVSPSLVVCLDLRTFLALSRAVGLKRSLKMDEAINSPFKIDNSIVHCVAHTGSFGMNNRGRSQVQMDWRKLVDSINRKVSA